MCTSHEPGQESARAHSGRRNFLRATALLGAAATVALPTATAQAAPRRPKPDPASRRFTLAVMPDTQYLFDGPSIDREPVEASLKYLLEHGEEENIVFLSHLGDLTQNGTAEETAAIGRAFRLLDRKGVGYSVLAGNHDVRSSTDDQRGPTPYLDAFGPDRFQGRPTFGGASPDGYNSFHLFEAGGRQWMVLALDWRLSAKGFAWATDVLARHPRTPVVLTTHELVDGDDSLSPYGQTLWDRLVKDHDQIFLTLNGHYWPAARATRRNTADNDVHLHLTNYQNRYFGGAAMIRLYRFDLDRNTIDVETVSPWILGRAAEGLNELERQESELSGDADRFTVEIDFEKRFAGFAPVPARASRPVSRMLIPGTVAYWRFDGRQDGGKVGGTVPDRSGRGNDLTLVSVGGGSLIWSADHHPDQPGHGSLEFDGGKPPLKGAYLRTVDGAPLNSLTFRGRLHRRGVLPAARRLGPLAPRLGRHSRQDRHRGRGGQDRRRPRRAAGHAVAVERPGAAVGGAPAQPAGHRHQLGAGDPAGDMVAPRRRQRREAHHALRRGLSGRAQPEGVRRRTGLGGTAVDPRRLRVRRKDRPDPARTAR